MAPTTERLTTVPTPAPLDVEWQYNGDFWEIGYHERRPWGKGTREGEWIVLATVNLECSLDPEADETWKLVHRIGCLMAAAPRMQATLRRIKAMMDAEPDQFSFKERADVEGALLWAEREADNWTKDD